MATTKIHSTFIPSDNQITDDFESFKAHSGPPKGYKRVSSDSLPKEAITVAQSLLKYDFGALTPFEVDNRSFVGRVEPHYHKPGGKARPWGVHKGVTIFESNNSGFFIEEDFPKKSDLLSKLDHFLNTQLA